MEHIKVLGLSLLAVQPDEPLAISCPVSLCVRPREDWMLEQRLAAANDSPGLVADVGKSVNHLVTILFIQPMALS